MFNSLLTSNYKKLSKLKLMTNYEKINHFKEMLTRRTNDKSNASYSKLFMSSISLIHTKSYNNSSSIDIRSELDFVILDTNIASMDNKFAQLRPVIQT